MSVATPPNDTFDAQHRAVLERIACGAPLAEILDGICQLVEGQADGMRCTILLVDADRTRVRCGAGPSLPAEYMRGLDGAAIGPAAGSCGTAAFLGERVIVEDIAAHPYWLNYKHLALPHGLRACWSSPVFSPEREVLGTFALYYLTPRGPEPREVHWVDVATHLAAVALLRDRTADTLRRSEARYRQLARLYAVSNRVNEAIVREREPMQLYEFACRVAVEQGFARLAWIGIVDASPLLDTGEHRLSAVARHGHDEGYVDRVVKALLDPATAAGPAVRALATRTCAVSNDISTDASFHSREYALQRGYRSCAVFPLVVDGVAIGVFALYADAIGAFGDEEVQALTALADDIAFGVEAAAGERERRRLLHDLGERVKELTLVHQVARLLGRERPVDGALLADLAALLPGAWQYPDACEARVSLGELEARTPGWRESAWMQTASFDVADRRGRIEVAYTRELPTAHEGPFVAEERQLIQSVADMLAAYAGRRHVQESLRQSEDRLRAVIEFTPNVAIQWFDARGRVLFANKATLDQFGWTPESAIGRSLGELNFNDAEAARFEALLGDVIATGVPAGPMEFEFRRPDGRVGILLSTIFRIPYSGTEYCGVCMDVDLTAHRALEAEAHAQERLRALVYASVADVIFYLAVEPGEQFRFLSVNPAFLRATGLTEERVVGQYVRDVIPEPSLSVALGHYREAIATRGVVTWEEVTEYPSGTRYGEVTVAPVFDASGACTNLVGTVHDITPRRGAEEERRKLETQLQQAQRLQALGTLAGGIAHDFNNILTAIRGHTDLVLAEEHITADDARESLGEIAKASRRATDLVRRILTFSRHDEPRREPLTLVAIVPEAVELLRATLPRTITIQFRAYGAASLVLADPTQIHQIVMNLGTNAMHAMRGKSGEIGINIETLAVDGDAARMIADLAPGNYVRLRISDQGTGMDDATKARVFEPFFTTKPVGEGTGLGLSVVHGIVKNHGGAVVIDSVVGRGTTFDLYFPVHAGGADAEPTPPPRRPTPRAGTRMPSVAKHVLYVDDDEALVVLATRILRHLGYRVTGHADPRNALNDFRARPQEFDAVISDVSMPAMTGPDLARAMLQIRADTFVVLVSGYVRAEDIAQARAVGVDSVILKPQTADEFAHMLHERIGGAVLDVGAA